MLMCMGINERVTIAHQDPSWEYPSELSDRVRKYEQAIEDGEWADDPRKTWPLHEEVRRQRKEMERVLFERVIRDMYRADVPPEDVRKIHNYVAELVLEILDNAFKNGNKFDPNKSVRVEYRIEDGELELSVEDDGSGFDVQAQRHKERNANPLESFGGRGMLMIEMRADDVEWNAKGNRITVRRDLRSTALRDLPPVEEIGDPFSVMV